MINNLNDLIEALKLYGLLTNNLTLFKILDNPEFWSSLVKEDLKDAEKAYNLYPELISRLETAITRTKNVAAAQAYSAEIKKQKDNQKNLLEHARRVREHAIKMGLKID